MKAVRFVGAGCPAQVVEVPTPRPGPGEILIKVGGAGACHSDLRLPNFAWRRVIRSKRGMRENGFCRLRC